MVTDPVLLESIITLPLDLTSGRPSFSDRLRLSTGWTPEYARRVIGEYRRFLYLAAVTRETIVPSPEIDQVWQLHLSYTQSYWEELCMKVLHRPLHHLPAAHGRVPRAREHVAYERARRLYQLEFGTPPPAGIWCEPDALFGANRMICERVNLRRYWIIPKPRLTWQTFALIAPAVLVPAALGSRDWTAGVLAAGLAMLGLLAAALIADYQQKRGISL